MANKKEQQVSNKTIYVVVGAFMLIGIITLAILAFLKQDALFLNGDTQQKACTMEAKLCADGSSVGRVGPNCEFAACPAFPSGATVISKKPFGAVGSIGADASFKSFTAYNEEQWATLRNNLGDESTPYPQLDFSKEFVFAATLGVRATGGYGLTLKSITETDTKIDIVFQEILPGAGCMVTQATTRPYMIVRKDTPAAIAEKKSIEITLVKVPGTACN